MQVNFENLELIPLLLEKIEKLEERQKKLLPPITSKKEVAKFLQKSERTVNNYMSIGLLVENVHYFRKSAKIIVFIESAIFDFRDQLTRGVADEKVAI